VIDKIIVYENPLEALLCFILDIPMNDEFKKLKIYPTIHLLEKAKENTSSLSEINLNLIKEISKFLSTFNHTPVKKFLEVLNFRKFNVTEILRNNVRNELEKVISNKNEITYQPTENEVINQILYKKKYFIETLINEEISSVNHLNENLKSHVENIQRKYEHSSININLLEREIAIEKGKKDYKNKLEEKIFLSNNYLLNTTFILFMCWDKNLI